MAIHTIVVTQTINVVIRRIRIHCLGAMNSCEFILTEPRAWLVSYLIQAVHSFFQPTSEKKAAHQVIEPFHYLVAQGRKNCMLMVKTAAEVSYIVCPGGHSHHKRNIINLKNSKKKYL